MAKTIPRLGSRTGLGFLRWTFLRSFALMDFSVHRVSDFRGSLARQLRSPSRQFGSALIYIFLRQCCSCFLYYFTIYLFLTTALLSSIWSGIFQYRYAQIHCSFWPASRQFLQRTDSYSLEPDALSHDSLLCLCFQWHIASSLVGDIFNAPMPDLTSVYRIPLLALFPPHTLVLSPSPLDNKPR